MKENHLTRGRKLEVRWRLEVGALLVLVKPRMLASPHADIPAMVELYTSQLFPGRDFRVVQSYWSDLSRRDTEL